LDIVLNGIVSDECSQEASECLCTMLRETRDVDETRDVIEVLFPRVVALRSQLEKVVEEEDTDALKAITKVLATAAESWAVAIARQPAHFRPLVEAVLECAARDKDRDIIEFTFPFWYELKQYLVLERYIQTRLELVDVYSKLVDILLTHLEYPRPESGNEADLFEGDREQEEKFREFRHQMGDTLKDACEVMGVTDCLTKVLHAIQFWTQKYASQVKDTTVPHWQELEAPLFAMRALGRMVDKDESIVLPQLMPLLVQIPSHEKLRFATIMVLGRYTEWTAAHPEYLEPQFNYIVTSFQSDSKEIIRAAALSIKFFCTDCKHLLSGQVLQLQTFYDQILDKLPDLSKEEITEGVANVLAVQPVEETYRLLKTYCDPLIQRLMTKANNATDEEGKLALADHLQLITIFVQTVTPYIRPGQENPAVKYWQEIFPILSTVLDNFLDFTPICERICRCWRNMVISYRTAMAPMLAAMANKLASGFETSREGCFLWVTSAILREFSEDREHVSQSTTDDIYTFFEAQTTTFLRVMTELQPKDLPDVIDDFFRLLIDALLYYPQKLVPSPLMVPVVEAAIYALTLEQRDPLSSTLHFLRDLLSYGGDNPATSDGLPEAVAAQIKEIVQGILMSHGANLVKQVMAGMMITFPRDCFADGSGVLLALFELLPAQTTNWVSHTIQLLPQGTISPVEAERLMVKIKEKLQSNDAGNMRNVRALLQDFTNTYRRRNVAPRDGLGQLEATRFQFSG
jgi:transportin-3